MIKTIKIIVFATIIFSSLMRLINIDFFLRDELIYIGILLVLYDIIRYFYRKLKRNEEIQNENTSSK